MDIIDYISIKYEETLSLDSQLTKLRFGLEWNQEQGLILYPATALIDIAILIQKSLPDLPLAICDDDAEKIGTSFYGIKITSLEEAAQKMPAALIVNCEFRRDFSNYTFANVASRLPVSISSRFVNYRQIGDILPIGDRTSKHFDIYRKNSFFSQNRNKSLIKEAYNLFQDPLSQAVFISVLKRYCFSSDGLIPIISNEKEYFEDYYVKKLEHEVIVDCGGFDGDTLNNYLKLFGEQNFKEYILFEPDPKTYDSLKQNVQSLNETVRNKITMLPYAVGNENTTINFDAFGALGSVVNANGQTSVRAISMDDEISDKHPTLIKLDIEGYEKFALYGAKKIIARDRPVLAICVYHHYYDLYDLPLQIKHLVPDYHFILRAYEPQMDYICYAIPPERLNN